MAAVHLRHDLGRSIRRFRCVPDVTVYLVRTERCLTFLSLVFMLVQTFVLVPEITLVLRLTRIIAQVIGDVHVLVVRQSFDAYSVGQISGLRLDRRRDGSRW